MRPAYVIPLDDPRAKKLNLVGGKAASLARMRALKIPQMRGFCVTTKAYFNHIKQLDIFPVSGSWKRESIRQGFLRAVLSADLATEIKTNLASLNRQTLFRPFRVAVRSSASCEDLPEFSFAGQYDTFLNISGVEGVLESIQKCWASFWSERAFLYREKNKISHLTAGMAILVQEMVPAHVSGTLFTINPVSSNRQETVVEAVRGLGESLVSGKITPVTYLLSKSTLRAQEPLSNSALLSKQDLLVLARLGSRIERYYESPMDIEWAKSNHGVFILQARPITTVDKHPIEWAFCVKKRLSWTTEMLQVEGLAKRYFKKSLGINWEFKNAKLAGFCEYFDLKEQQDFDKMVAHLARRPATLGMIASRSYRVCARFKKMGAYLASASWAKKPRHRLLEELRYFHHEALKMIPVVYFLPNLDNLIKNLLLKKLRRLGNADRLEEYFLLLTSTTEPLTVIREHRDLLEIGALIQSSYPKLTPILRAGRLGQLCLPRAILFRLREHKKLYSWINTDDMFGRAWILRDFLERLKVLLKGNCVDRLKTAKERLAFRKAERQEALKKLRLSGQLLALVNVAKENSYLRTYRAGVYIRSFHQAVPLMEAVAKNLGLTYQDTLYLSFEEMESMLGDHILPSAINLHERRLGMAYIMNDRRIQTIFGKSARMFAAAESGERSQLKGTAVIKGVAANLGKAVGTARVVHDISELGKVRVGDVLVASMTIPEFAPAMEKAAAFVTDEGGITCHAAIISREMGIPCLIGTQNATKILRGGEMVEVDTFKGVVRRISVSNDSSG